MPPGTTYLNIGHSNLSRRVLRAIRALHGGRTAVFIHDTIPLDFPEFQRPGTVNRFRESLRLAGTHADLLIFNSARTKGDVERTLRRWNLSVPGVVAHLGVTPAAPTPRALPDGLPTDRPYFVVLGTIEPRKNHALLLDVWEDLAKSPANAVGPVPGLIILGARGWRNEEVFARLDRLPPDGPVREVNGLSDGAVAALVQGAAGLLQPSFAEGFGLPPVEAAALGTPVVCSDLAVFHEVLGDIPVYLSPGDRLTWTETITRLSAAHAQDGGPARADGSTGFVPPSWQDHFNIVFTMT